MADSPNLPVAMDAPPQCMLLRVLPRELRDMVYHFTFEGARVVVGPDYRRDTGMIVDWGHEFDAFRTSDQWQLLVTCRQAYEEGRAVFCAEMRLYCGFPYVPVSLSRAPDLVSGYTKARVRHLDLTGGPYLGDLYWIPEGVTFASFLGQFRSLETCVLPPMTIGGARIWHWEVLVQAARMQLLWERLGDLAGRVKFARKVTYEAQMFMVRNALVEVRVARRVSCRYFDLQPSSPHTLSSRHGPGHNANRDAVIGAFMLRKLHPLEVLCTARGEL